MFETLNVNLIIFKWDFREAFNLLLKAGTTISTWSLFSCRHHADFWRITSWFLNPQPSAAPSGQQCTVKHFYQRTVHVRLWGTSASTPLNLTGKYRPIVNSLMGHWSQMKTTQHTPHDGTRRQVSAEVNGIYLLGIMDTGILFDPS